MCLLQVLLFQTPHAAMEPGMVLALPGIGSGSWIATLTATGSDFDYKHVIDYFWPAVAPQLVSACHQLV